MARRVVLLVPLTLLALACGGGKSTTTGNNQGGAGGEAAFCGLTEAAHDEFCQANANELDCGVVSAFAEHHVCGIAVPAPPSELARSPNVEEYAGDGPPNLTCFQPESYPPAPGTPETITMRGVAEIFSNGCESKEVQIEVYTVKRTGGDDDGDLDTLVGAAVVTADNCLADAMSEVDDCPGGRFECFYEYAGVPTETELVIRTGDPAGATVPRWSTVYEYNLFIRNEQVVAGEFEKDVRALAKDDYGTIAQAALGTTIKPGNGAIAGEIHDCEDKRLRNAVVDIDSQKGIVTYFSDVEDAPLPNLAAKGTSTLGLYAAIDVKPGPVTLAAAGLLNGEVVTTGFYRARIFPDSVTSVTFRGLPPAFLP